MREEKEKVVLKGLAKLGLSVEMGSKHNLATNHKTGCKTTVPRHKIISSLTLDSICVFLANEGFSERDIKAAFKWK